MVGIQLFVLKNPCDHKQGKNLGVDLSKTPKIKLKKIKIGIKIK